MRGENLPQMSVLEKLVKKNFKCTFAPLEGEEEQSMIQILKNKESINKVIGKAVDPSVSCNFLYYLAMCHLFHRQKNTDMIDKGGEMLIIAASFGCDAAWWELSTKQDDDIEKVKCIVRGYDFKDPNCISYVTENYEEVLADLIVIIPSDGRNGWEYVKYFLRILLAHKAPVHTTIMMSPAWKTVEIPDKDTEIVVDLLKQLLLPNQDELYAEIIDSYDLSNDLEELD